MNRLRQVNWKKEIKLFFLAFVQLFTGVVKVNQKLIRKQFFSQVFWYIALYIVLTQSYSALYMAGYVDNNSFIVTVLYILQLLLYVILVKRLADAGMTFIFSIIIVIAGVFCAYIVPILTNGSLFVFNNVFMKLIWILTFMSTNRMTTTSHNPLMLFMFNERTPNMQISEPKQEGKITFKQSIKDAYKYCLTPSGYTTRSGFWKYVLYASIASSLVIAIVILALLRFAGNLLMLFYIMIYMNFLYILLMMIITAPFTIPAIGLVIRRLRDVGLNNKAITLVLVINYILFYAMLFSMPIFILGIHNMYVIAIIAIGSIWSIIYIVLLCLTSNCLVAKNKDKSFFFRVK